MPSINIVRIMTGFLRLLRNAVRWMPLIRRSRASSTRSIVLTVQGRVNIREVPLISIRHLRMQALTERKQKAATMCLEYA